MVAIEFAVIWDVKQGRGQKVIWTRDKNMIPSTLSGEGQSWTEAYKNLRNIIRGASDEAIPNPSRHSEED